MIFSLIVTFNFFLTREDLNELQTRASYIAIDSAVFKNVKLDFARFKFHFRIF